LFLLDFLLKDRNIEHIGGPGRQIPPGQAGSFCRIGAQAGAKPGGPGRAWTPLVPLLQLV